MSGYTLFTDVGNFRAFKILICAEYNGVELDIPAFKVGVDNKSASFLKKSPLGRVPCLETPKGSIFESNAIARHVAQLRRDTELMGSSFFASAQVDSWVDFCSHDLELPATMWIYPALGYLPYNAEACAKAKADFARALAVLEAHLSDKTYLVGHQITLADIAIVCTLLYPFKFTADAAYRAPFPNVMRWFTTCVNQPQFDAVIGSVVLCDKETTANGASVVAFAAGGGAAKSGGGKAAEKAPKADKPKAEKAPKADKPKEEKPKEEKKPKKKDDDDEPEPDFVEEKKEEHPFKIMDKASPSPFQMDTWKKTYSNCKGDYKGAMAQFWSGENAFDPAHWSLFRGDYKYDDECKVLFMTSNLIGGFIQRTEEIRKWLFGTMTIRGEEGKMKVTCYYLIRGDSIEPLIKCNDDASCYTWTKLAVPVSDADKATIYDYWCSDVRFISFFASFFYASLAHPTRSPHPSFFHFSPTQGPLDGEPLLDSRCYK